MLLTPHFTRADLERSAVAQRKDIANILPDEFIPVWTAGLKALVEPVHDRAADLVITSAYRSPELNRAIGGSANSQHCGRFVMRHRNPPKHVLCCAFDLSLPERSGGNRALWNIIYDLKLPFDQLIWEFGSNHAPAWIHLSYVPGYSQRGHVLRAIKGSFSRINHDRLPELPRLAQIVSDTPPFIPTGTHAGGSQAHT